MKLKISGYLLLALAILWIIMSLYLTKSLCTFTSCPVNEPGNPSPPCGCDFYEKIKIFSITALPSLICLVVIIIYLIKKK
ncbi:MAG: hypothetical protein Q8N99_00575 [Nanoarchaeota archaeon]|nr:hypothetical protein [Nanoarchaeota archaeon]